jgi:hypothetical protein
LLSPSKNSLLLRCGVEIDFLKSTSPGEYFEYDAEALKEDVFGKDFPVLKLTAAATQKDYLPETKVEAAEIVGAKELVDSTMFIRDWSTLFGWKDKLVAGG